MNILKWQFVLVNNQNQASEETTQLFVSNNEISKFCKSTKFWKYEYDIWFRFRILYYEIINILSRHNFNWSLFLNFIVNLSMISSRFHRFKCSQIWDVMKQVWYSSFLLIPFLLFQILEHCQVTEWSIPKPLICLFWVLSCLPPFAALYWRVCLVKIRSVWNRFCTIGCNSNDTIARQHAWKQTIIGSHFLCYCPQSFLHMWL